MVVLKIFKIIKTIIVFLIILGFYMIAKYSFYGVLDENGNKITNMQELLQKEEEKNEIEDEIIEIEENNAISDEVITDVNTAIDNISSSVSKNNIGVVHIVVNGL